MHYKNGREAKVGDQVLAIGYNGIVTHEVVIAASASSDTCNLTTVQVGQNTATRTAKECLHIDDAHNLK